MSVCDLKKLRELSVRRFADVPGLDEYDCAFRVRSLTELENSELIQLWQLDDDGVQDPTKRHLLRSRMIQICLVDEDGEPLFEDGGGEFPQSGLAEVGYMDSMVTQTIGDFLFEFLGLLGKAARIQEDAEKN